MTSHKRISSLLLLLLFTAAMTLTSCVTDDPDVEDTASPVATIR